MMDNETPLLEQDLPRAIEAVLLCATEPVSELLLTELTQHSLDAVNAACKSLAEQLVERNAGFELTHVAGGWRFQTLSDFGDVLGRFALSGQSQRVSSAALETLSIIAYKQPLSRSQISAIRGVSVDGVMNTLVKRGYIAELGEDTGPGRAILYGTTPFFLERLGISSIDDLPELGDFVPSAQVLEVLEKTLTSSGSEEETANVEVDIDLTELEASEVEAAKTTGVS